ncbi:MAG: flagellar export chaperone FliS [Candidatus Bathyarchaeia archaeon]
MFQLRGVSAYRDVKNFVDSEDKLKLLITTFREMIDKLDLVEEAIKKRDFQRKFTELSKVEQVLQILDSSLDRSYGEISENLSALYNYILANLRKVHITLEISRIEESKSLLRTILEGFEKAYEMKRRKASSKEKGEENLKTSLEAIL